MPISWKHLQKDLELVNGLSLDQVLWKSGVFPRKVHNELGTMLGERCYHSSHRTDNPFFVQRFPLSRGKLKSFGKGKVSSHIPRSSDSCMRRIWGRSKWNGAPLYLTGGQSVGLREIEAEVPVHDEEPREDQIVLQQYVQQVESFSSENKLSKFERKRACCRSWTIFRDKRCWGIQPNNGLSRRHPSTRRQSFSTYGVDPRKYENNWICVGSYDEFSERNWNSNWVRESRQFSILGQNISWNGEYVVDSIQDNTEIPADPQEEQIPQKSTSVVAARSKAKAQPHPRESTGVTTIPLNERVWIDVEQSKQDLECDLSKKVINLFRHNQKLHREKDGGTQFCKNKVPSTRPSSQNWSNDQCLNYLAGRPKRKYKNCSDDLGSILHLCAILLILHNRTTCWLDGPGIFLYIYHVGSNFNLHSVISNVLILGGQNLNKRQTVFFLPVDPRKKDHQDPEHIDYFAPRFARYMHRAWRKHQDAVF